MKRAFTIVELVIVIAIIAIISVILLPQLTKTFESSKENIIDIYNGASIRVINIDTNEIIYDGNKTDFVLDSGYELIDVSYSDGNVTMYVKILE